MQKEEILARVKKHGLCTISWPEFHQLFPGRCLDEVEMQFKIEFAKASGGKTYNPTGSSHHDQLMRFLDENHLCYRLVDEKPTFHRRGIDFSEHDARQKKAED